MPATTGGLTPIQEHLFYIGMSKQAQWGSPVAPSWFWTWIDGTDANPKTSFGKERQGDTSPDISLVWKQGQWWEIKIVEYVRPIMAGIALQALHCSGSDAYTAPTINATLAAAVAAGATQFTTATNLGNTGTQYLNATPGYSSQVYEVVQANLASQAGTGPYTYTLANGAKFRNAHATGDALTSPSTHTFTRTPLTYDAYSLDLGWGSSVGGLSKAIRVQDAVCVELDIDSAAKSLLKFTHTWYGTLSTLDAALASSLVFEGQNVIGVAGGPFAHNQSQSNWQVDGSSSGNGATVKKFSLKLKNTTVADEFQTDGLNPRYFTPGVIDRTGSIDVVFNSFAQYMETYYGSATPASGANDSYLVGYGAISTNYVADAVNSVGISLPNVYYTAPKLTPKRDGKALTQSLAFEASRPSASVVPHTITLSNSYDVPY